MTLSRSLTRLLVIVALVLFVGNYAKHYMLQHSFSSWMVQQKGKMKAIAIKPWYWPRVVVEEAEFKLARQQFSIKKLKLTQMPYDFLRFCVRGEGVQITSPIGSGYATAPYLKIESSRAKVNRDGSKIILTDTKFKESIFSYLLGPYYIPKAGGDFEYDKKSREFDLDAEIPSVRLYSDPEGDLFSLKVKGELTFSKDRRATGELKLKIGQLKRFIKQLVKSGLITKAEGKLIRFGGSLLSQEDESGEEEVPVTLNFKNGVPYFGPIRIADRLFKRSKQAQ